MRASFCLAVLAACIVLVPTLASADIGGVPNNLVVVAGGLDWVWASPCAPVQPSCGSDIVLSNGWQIASTADFLASFTGYRDLYDALNPGGVQLCASAYFSSGYNHCDNDNILGAPGVNQAVWNAPTGAWGGVGNVSYAETFLVQGAVPEPGSLMLFGSGLVGLAGVLRRKFNL